MKSLYLLRSRGTRFAIIRDYRADTLHDFTCWLITCLLLDSFLLESLLASSSSELILGPNTCCPLSSLTVQGPWSSLLFPTMKTMIFRTVRLHSCSMLPCLSCWRRSLWSHFPTAKALLAWCVQDIMKDYPLKASDSNHKTMRYSCCVL